MIEQRWCTIDGKSWTLTVGDINAIVWLWDDEKTYGANLWWPNGDSSSEGEFDCIKKAKAACLEAIEDAEDIADAMAVLADPDDTIISEVEL